MFTTSTAAPAAATALLTALRGAGLAAHYDAGEEVVLAYSPSTNRDHVESAHHVMVVSQAFDAQWPFEWAGYEAHAWAPGGPYGTQEVKRLHDTPHDRRALAAEEAAACAKVAAEWLSAAPTAATTMRTTIIDALTTAGVGVFWDTDEGHLIAHRAGLTEAEALYDEHILIGWTTASDPTDLDAATLDATAWEPDGPPDYTRLGTVYETPNRPSPGQEVAHCARAVAEWFATPRPTAGGVLLAALAEYGISTYDNHRGMSYAFPFDADTPAEEIYNGFHLSIGDRNPSVDHVPAAHTGWTIFLHAPHGEPLANGEPLYISGDGGLVDCAEDSAAAAAVIADLLTDEEAMAKYRQEWQKRQQQ